MGCGLCVGEDGEEGRGGGATRVRPEETPLHGKQALRN